MKRSKQIILLGLLACLGAWGQTLYSVRVGLNIAGPRFRVDGQDYTSPQNFMWPAGSRHVIQFPFSVEETQVTPYQYLDYRVTRYGFSGWTLVDSAGTPAETGTTISVQASPTLTEIVGNVTQEHLIHLNFPDSPPDSEACSNGSFKPPVDVPRYGIVYIDGQCHENTDQDIWLTAGPHVFSAYPYPGWLFNGWFFDNQIPPNPYTTMTFMADHPMTIIPQFVQAKRVRFSSIPAGRRIYVDTSLITLPAPIPVNTPEPINIDPVNCTPDYTRIPGDAPLGFTPLCMGDFDFLPNSEHRLAAPESQRDQTGKLWVFDRFSTGGGQNSVYKADDRITLKDYVTAHFVPGAPSRISTQPARLKVIIDGRDAYPNSELGYGFEWGEGHVHHLKAPLEQTLNGRKYRFVAWSDGGEAEHTVSLAPGAPGLNVVATYELLGQIKVTSAPTGLKLTVGGAECTTPCTFDESAGATLNMSAPKSIAMGDVSRYDFDSWNGSSGLAHDATFNSGVQILTAYYHASHMVLTYTNPPDAASFEFSPASPDGYYAEGTTVQVSIVAKEGHKFMRWEGDLTGNLQPGNLKIVGPRTVIARFEEVPFIAPAGIRNAAGDTPDDTIAPGSIVSIYGENLSSVTQIGPSNPWAQAIGNVYVTVNDRLLPLILVSPTQINAQMLSDLPNGQYTLKVHQVGQPDVTGTFTVRRNSPGLFYWVTEDGTPVVAALRQDGTPITPDNAPQRGEVVTMFGTGFGPYNKPIIDGFTAPTNQLLPLADPVAIVAGLPEAALSVMEPSERPAAATVDATWAGAAPGLVGAAIVQMKVGETVPAGSSLELFVNVNGTESNRVQLPIAPAPAQ